MSLHMESYTTSILFRYDSEDWKHSKIQHITTSITNVSRIPFSSRILLFSFSSSLQNFVSCLYFIDHTTFYSNPAIKIQTTYLLGSSELTMLKLMVLMMTCYTALCFPPNGSRNAASRSEGKLMLQ